MGYIIALVEQCADPKQGGGTGKNIFINPAEQKHDDREEHRSVRSGTAE